MKADAAGGRAKAKSTAAKAKAKAKPKMKKMFARTEEEIAMREAELVDSDEEGM